MTQEISLEELQKAFRTEACAVHGISLRGISHEMGGMPLQDSFAARQLSNGWIVLAVADGVGSEPRSDIGAQKAVAAVVRHLDRFRGYRIDDRSIEIMLHAAYESACADIYEQAIRDNAPFREYSTTLHTVIFSDGLLYIMHAGDGGVAVLTEDGEFKRVTSPMKDQDGEAVIPLQAGPDAWRFSVFRERAQSVVVATDGVWDKLCPPILAGYGYESGIEKSIASYFMSPWARDWKKEPLEEIAAKEKSLFRAEMQEAVPEFYNTLVAAVAQGKNAGEALELVSTRVAPGNVPLKLLRGIKDDITLLSLVRFAPEMRRTPASLFDPPDWAAVNQWANELLYRPAPEPKSEETRQTDTEAVNRDFPGFSDETTEELS